MKPLFDTIRRILGRGLDQIFTPQIVPTQPSFGTPSEYPTGRDSDFIRKFFAGHDSAKIRDSQAGALIPKLHIRRRPSAIARLVIATWIDAINGMAAAWARPHVSEKRVEIVFPAIANNDPAPTVIRKASAFGVIAPRLHPRPNTILWRLSSRLGQILLRPICTKATAAIGRPLSQIRAKADGLLAAVTFTQPRQMLPTAGRLRFNDQSAKSAPHKINLPHQKTISLRDARGQLS